MLSVEAVMRLNEMMIGRGVPIEKDDVGYNRPDYMRMYIIGMLNVSYNPMEMYVALKTLSHYKNTQLAAYKDEIEETLKRYEEIVDSMISFDSELSYLEARAISGKEHKKEDYAQETLHTVSINPDEGNIYVKFKEFVDLNPRDFGGRWVDNGVVSIPFERLQEFVAGLINYGKCGYKPDDKLTSFIEERLDGILAEADEKRRQVEEQKRQQDERELMAMQNGFVLVNEKKKSDYNIPIYSIGENNKKLAERLWEGKGKALTYVDTKTSDKKIFINIKDTQIKAFREFATELNIDCRCFDEMEEEKANRNKSGRTLVDISNLDLSFTPYPFQLEDANEIVGRKRALIGHDMGAGKTFISTLVGISINKPKLVICPESLRLNWVRELEKNHKGANIKLVYSDDKEYKTNGYLTFGKDWTIMGYQTATKFYKEILSEGIECVFIDEAHNCKAVDNYGRPDSKRARAIMNIASKADNCYLITGTPMPTRNKDLYNEFVMLDLIDANAPYAFHRFGLRYCDGQKNGFGWDYNGSSNKEELSDMLRSVMTRRLKSEVLSHLTKQRMMIPVVPEAKPFREYKTIEKDLYNLKDDQTYMGLAMSGRKVLSESRMNAAADLAESFVSAEESVVIVTEFNETMDTLIEKFGDNACFIRGGMTDNAKQQAIDDFQSGKKKVCILNTIAGGVGITLTKAHNMIICDYDWTPANMTQVEDRICRNGQTEPCSIYYLYCEEAVLDRVFIDMITDKSANIDSIVDKMDNTVDLSETRKSSKTYMDLLKEELKKDAPKKERKPRAKKKMPEHGDE